MDESPAKSINNKILAALSADEYQRLQPNLEAIELVHGKVLYEMGQRIEYVYFPSNAMISLVTQMKNGTIVEVGIVGRDGMAGIEALMGEETSTERAIVQIPNGGIRAKLSVVKEEFKRGGELHHLLLAYTRVLLKQVAQTAACNATHKVEKRLARWLLMCQDRIDSTELNLTQEFIGEMLATRRATVSVAAMTLQTEGYIKYNRGQIRIVDRTGLEAFACECYHALKNS